MKTIKFSSLRKGSMFKAFKLSPMIYEKVVPAMTPYQHNAVTINTRTAMYDWFESNETVYRHEGNNDGN